MILSSDNLEPEGTKLTFERRMPRNYAILQNNKEIVDKLEDLWYNINNNKSPKVFSKCRT